MKLYRWYPPRFKRVLELYEDEDLTARQVGRRLGESTSTIEKALIKARKMRENEEFNDED